MSCNLWDILLLIIVPTMALGMAYVYDPRLKALILSFPLPFTISYLSLGQPVNVTHVFGLLLLLGFTHLVRILHRKLSIQIIFSIVISAVLYTLFGGVIAAFIPKSEVLFWSSSAVLMVISGMILTFQKAPSESGMRTTMPAALKVPLTLSIVFVIIVFKQILQGFMTLFPMVGVFGAFEGRLSLGTNCRQIPKLTLSMVPMFAVLRLTEPILGKGVALGLGWLVFIPIMGMFMKSSWKKRTNIPYRVNSSQKNQDGNGCYL
ncbi:MAG: hypothetical protein ISR78_02375 [Spirochaetia bacterium]|nr:hypothetical protein [Spirochaetia bacterium]